MIEKCALAVMGAEAKKSLGMEQLCRGLEAGTERGIDVLRLLWQQHT